MKKLLLAVIALTSCVLTGTAQGKMKYPEPAQMPTPIESTSPPKFGYFNLSNEGKFILQIPYIFQDAELFNWNIGLARVKFDDHFGFIDKGGTFQIDPIYDEARGFNEYNVCVVVIGDKCGVINTKGHYVIPLEYSDLSDMLNGWFELYKDGEFVGYQSAVDGRKAATLSEYHRMISE